MNQEDGVIRKMVVIINDAVIICSFYYVIFLFKIRTFHHSYYRDPADMRKRVISYQP